MSYNTLFYIYIIYLYSYNRPFECNLYADVARDEIEFDTPDLHAQRPTYITHYRKWKPPKSIIRPLLVCLILVKCLYNLSELYYYKQQRTKSNVLCSDCI